MATINIGLCWLTNQHNSFSTYTTFYEKRMDKNQTNTTLLKESHIPIGLFMKSCDISHPSQPFLKSSFSKGHLVLGVVNHDHPYISTQLSYGAYIQVVAHVKCLWAHVAPFLPYQAQSHFPRIPESYWDEFMYCF